MLFVLGPQLIKVVTFLVFSGQFSKQNCISYKQNYICKTLSLDLTKKILFAGNEIFSCPKLRSLVKKNFCGCSISLAHEVPFQFLSIYQNIHNSRTSYTQLLIEHS